ncbi:MAG: bifunctional DNA-formamidopyrimidine glycosylase/DNA-(apurinic or apyrimidinic site) lyase [Candidatus Accumulibacter sp.]|jgi:formamidopyrimidine-DNA glycosylase|nr:bifunctional DNA-formamidopyrimidine glycosylase/DNA-(apurinic or apyrimidinic site) lyase [Accumulibacter sp.]
MPELPEVEVSRLGLLPHLPGQPIVQAIFRAPKLRHALSPELAAKLAGKRVRAILRRGKYLLFDCAGSGSEDRGQDSEDRGQKTEDSSVSGRFAPGKNAGFHLPSSGIDRAGEPGNGVEGRGWLIVHLGMSGSLRLVPVGAPAQKHDHVDLVFPATVLRLRDPRRFGALLWHEGADVERHPSIAALGVEPLSPGFDGEWLYAATRRRKTPIKPLLMNARLLVGVGNIYAAEALFRAGIAPARAAGRLSRERCHRLAAAIRATLEESIAAGGSSVRDYVHSDGGAGSFQLNCAVYGRAGQPCQVCGTPISALRQAGRSSFYCPRCQH